MAVAANIIEGGYGHVTYKKETNLQFERKNPGVMHAVKQKNHPGHYSLIIMARIFDLLIVFI
jgi:hypothetical protein